MNSTMLKSVSVETFLSFKLWRTVASIIGIESFGDTVGAKETDGDEEGREDGSGDGGPEGSGVSSRSWAFSCDAGSLLGCAVGTKLGEALGAALGAAVGVSLGNILEDSEGRAEGSDVGLGPPVGKSVTGPVGDGDFGIKVGLVVVGSFVGVLEGTRVGVEVISSVGAPVSLLVEPGVGASVDDPELETTVG